MTTLHARSVGFAFANISPGALFGTSGAGETTAPSNFWAGHIRTLISSPNAKLPQCSIRRSPAVEVLP